MTIEKIINYLEKHGRIDSESVGYNRPDDGCDAFTFSMEEFNNLVVKIWADAGGFDEEEKYLFEDCIFRTFIVPFSFNGKEYFMIEMSGQGTIEILLTEAVRKTEATLS